MVVSGEIGAFLPPPSSPRNSGGRWAFEIDLGFDVAALMLGKWRIVVAEEKRLQENEDDDDEAKDERVYRFVFERCSESKPTDKVSTCCADDVSQSSKSYVGKGDQSVYACVFADGRPTNRLIGGGNEHHERAAGNLDLDPEIREHEKADGSCWS